MAQATGITCDSCGQFVAHKYTLGQKYTLPPSWYEVWTVLDSNERVLVGEVCSGRCLERLARLRRELDKPPLASVASPNGIGGRARTGHRINHVNKGIINPDCAYCQEETSP